MGMRAVLQAEGDVQASAPLQRGAERDAHVEDVVRSPGRPLDRATREFMERFYAGLFKGKKSAALALREAKLAMRKAEPERPDKWAAFVLAGEWR